MRPKTKKIILGIIAVPVGLIAIPLVLILLFLFLLGAGEIIALFKPNPPEPVIQHGEFPFEIVYSINDEVFTAEGVVVCEYEGVGLGISWPNQYVPDKELNWSTHIKGTEDYQLLVYEHKYGKVYCDVGFAEYYMGEPFESYLPTAKLYDELYDVSDYFNKARTAEEFKEKYGIEILSYKFSPPIENTFK